MESIPQLKLLIKNPILDNWIIIHSSLIQKLLGHELQIPVKISRPFLFSTFVSSLDGKLCYPDHLSGYGITQYNLHASQLEKAADKIYLLSGRAIADAVIIGARSLNIEPLNHPPILDEISIQNERVSNGKSKNPATIIICRDLKQINFNNRLFTDQEMQVFICCFKPKIDQSVIPKNFNLSYLSRLDANKNLKNLLIIDTSLSLMFEKFKHLGFNIIMNESPFFHHELIRAKILDEIWLNYSCSYIGGITTSLGDKQSAFSSLDHPDTQILTLHHLGYNFLYSRQQILYNNLN